MKFTVNRETLLKYMKSMLLIVPQTSPVEELEGFLFEANENDGCLYLTANNLECAARIQIHAKVEIGGNFVMKAKSITGYIDALSGEDVTFLEIKPGIVTLQSGRCIYTLQAIDATSYPKPQAPMPETVFHTKGLNSLYAKTVAVVPHNPTSKSLEGIHVEVSPKEVRAVSCSGTCIAAARIECNGGGKLDFTLNKKIFARVAAIVEDEDVDVGISGAYVVFTKDGVLIQARRLANEFVDVDKLFAVVKPVYEAKIEQQDIQGRLANICDIAGLGKEKGYIKLDFKESAIEMSTETDIGIGCETVRAVRTDSGKEYSFYYKASFLRNIFKTVDGTMIVQVTDKGYMMLFNRNCKYFVTSVSDVQAEKKKTKKAKATKTKKASKAA